MNPSVRKIDLYAVTVIDAFVPIELFHACKDGIDVRLRREVYTVLADTVVGQGTTQFAHFHIQMCQMAEEQRNTYQRIATVVALRIDHSTVAFTSDNRVYAFHLRYDIHFAYRAGTIFAAMSSRHVAQRTGTGHITYRVARGVTQDIIRYADQGIFLAEHLSVLADDRQTIDIRIHYKTDIRLTALEQVADLGQVLRQRFGIVGETTIRRAVQLDDVRYAYGFQDRRNS